MGDKSSMPSFQFGPNDGDWAGIILSSGMVSEQPRPRNVCTSRADPSKMAPHDGDRLTLHCSFGNIPVKFLVGRVTHVVTGCILKTGIAWRDSLVDRCQDVPAFDPFRITIMSYGVSVLTYLNKNLLVVTLVSKWGTDSLQKDNYEDPSNLRC